jgi:hypothetical protein
VCAMAYSSVKTGNPPLPIFDGQCLQSISSKASSVLKMLTRGEEGVFTRLVGKLLYNQCLQVVSAYTDTVYFHACYNSDDRRRHDEHHLLALFMGLHARLGTASPLSRLDADVLRHISASLFMPRDLALLEFVQREMWLF